MKIVYLPIGAALSLMLMWTPLSPVAATDGPARRAPVRSAALQFAQDNPNDSYSNAPTDQPDENAATNNNSDQAGDENNASGYAPSDENSADSAQMNPNPESGENPEQTTPNPGNDQGQDYGNPQ